MSSESSKLFKLKSTLIDSEKTNNYIYANVIKYLILKMNEKLERIIDKLETDDILIQTEKEQKQKVRDIINIVYRLKSAINSSRINDDLEELNTLKEQTQDFNNYYIKKYDNIFEQFPNEIHFYFPLCYFYYFPPIRLIQHIRRIKLFEKFFKEFYLINNLYELSLEILIYINIALCNYYIKTSNFKEADSIINEMFDSNSLFNNNVKKVKDIQKIISAPSLSVGIRWEFTYGPAYFDFQREKAKIRIKADAYLKNNFCCYIELLRDIKNIMSKEIYILEINDIKYLIFNDNLEINDIKYLIFNNLHKCNLDCKFCCI
ncbi:hypothetical protein R4Q14_15285 [Brachyspira intermedia]|uniref:hypothetical protein n=1 Tax=Brachyspira intermedia TaxID=84377 RepID=UPI00300418B8